ncbi:hypothetical protein TMatcc_002964 [Talaromyces marneffei ATCC 18224]|uniref:Benzoate 4-monooxygenase cytochrome P450, putative n=2 Tax=Talaromyces marneffei TaxID=37727 RepID=B6Q720_TALMQ|nr:benzoate 4-monooxygenase cytochrome P450, putative [Talaromyces marneffei ATCC 18224]
MDSLTSYLPPIVQAHPAASLAIIGAIAYITHGLGLVIYRLYFSPLAGFPGPKIAAATHWYEFYYNFWLQGKYIYQIEKMHKKYGPIVRINPGILCINDPDAYDEIYVSEAKRKTNNYQPFSQGLGFDGSHFLTEEHDLHRRRRKPLEPFFSRSGILRLQPLLAETIEKLDSRFAQAKGTGTVIRLDHAFFAMSGDVVGKLCWSEKEDFLDEPNFSPGWYNLIHGIIKSIYLFQMFPWIAQAANSLPKFLIARLLPQALVFDDFDRMTLRNVAVAKQAKLDKSERDPFRRKYPSLFHWIVNSEMPESELDDQRLANEAQVIMSAGSTSTARTLSHITCHILSRPDIRKRLGEELAQTMADWPAKIPTWVELEELPYLQALIKEGLRHSYSVMHPLPRVSPDAPIEYRQWTIPPGVAVAMSPYLMHTDTSVYSKPFEFMPERWLDENFNQDMMRNFVPFARGSRRCLGQNLAMAELSLALAVFFRPGGPRLELFESDTSDTNHVHDYVVPLPRLDTKGIRVTVN